MAPTVTISVASSPVVESGGGVNSLTINFAVNGDITDPNGLAVELAIDNPNNANNFWFLDLLSGELESDFYEIEGTGTNLLEVDSSGNLDAGSGKFGFIPPPFNQPFTLLLAPSASNSTASIEFPIFDDNVPEINEDVTITLNSGTGYTVGGTGTAVVTLQDSPGGTVNDPSPPAPEVSFHVDSNVLIETAETEFTFTVGVDGSIPTGGLDIKATNEITNSVGNFIVGRPKIDTDPNNPNPADPDDGDPGSGARFVVGAETTGLAGEYAPSLEQIAGGIGITVPDLIANFPDFVNDAGTAGLTGAFSLQPTEIADGFFGTVVDQTATITLQTRNDGFAEGITKLPFALVDGENYEINPFEGGEVLLIADDGISGTNSSDVLSGTNQNDVINGLGGKDKIFGKGGDDILDGSVGQDTISGGKGNDVIFGGSGRDKIFGGLGEDVINGGKGKDTITGGFGDDKIFGAAGQDVIYGGFGDDLLSGDGGRDKIFGGAGDDTIMGVTGNDTISGGAGKDTIVYGSGDGVDTIWGFNPFVDELALVAGEFDQGANGLEFVQDGLDVKLFAEFGTSSQEKLAVFKLASANVLENNTVVDDTFDDVSIANFSDFV